MCRHDTMTSRQIQSAEGAIVAEGLIAKFHTRPHRCCTQIIQSFSPRGAKYVHPHLIHGSFGGHESSQTNYLKTFATYPGLVELWPIMIILKLVFRSLKGRCHGSDFLVFIHKSDFHHTSS